MRPYVSVTSTSIAKTCPDTCRFKGSPGRPGGCYSQCGFTRFDMEKLDRGASGLSPEEVILQEVRLIDDAFNGGCIPHDGARGGHDLRLHVGGDVGSAAGARLLAMVARRWRLRGGGTVWTYTHLWRSIPRRDWGEAISVLASVENATEIEEARSRGYASALVVEAFPTGGRAFVRPGTRALIVPCPAEITEGRTCIECRLCLDRDLLKINRAVAFQIHGVARAAALLALQRAA
jgi:hypothetical protein